MESGGLDAGIISTTPLPKFLEENFHESIPYLRQRKHVINRVMPHSRLIYNISDVKLSPDAPIETAYKKSEDLGNRIMLTSGLSPGLLLPPLVSVSLSDYFEIGQKAYFSAYKSGRKINGYTPDVVNFEEMADNYKNLVRAIFEFMVSFLPRDKNLSEKVLSEVDRTLYFGELPYLYPILHGRSIEKPPTLH